MKKYIFGEKNSIHIIDLTQTVDFLKNALVKVHNIISGGGKLLIVSTKKQASEQVSDLAKETGQFYKLQMVRRDANKLEHDTKLNKKT